MANVAVGAGSGPSFRHAAGGWHHAHKATSLGNVFDLDENSFGVNVGGGVLASSTNASACAATSVTSARCRTATRATTSI
jgi:hypothetical protein